MKIKAKNIYGIRGELEIDSGDKNKVVLFGPNGVGKTSMAKAIQDVASNNEYSGITKWGDDSHFSLKTSNQEYKYDTEDYIDNFDVINNEKFIKIDNFEDFKDVLETYDKAKSGNIKHAPTMKLHKHIVDHYFDGQEPLNINTSEAFEISNEFVKMSQMKTEGNLKDIDQKIDAHKRLYSALKKNATIQRASGNRKKLSYYLEYIPKIEATDVVDDQKINDLEIMQSIIKKKGDKASVFGYSETNNGMYQAVDQAINSSWATKTKNALTNDEVELVISLSKINVTDFCPKDKKGNIKIDNQLASYAKDADIDKKLNDLLQNKFALIIQQESHNGKAFKSMVVKNAAEIEVTTNKLLTSINDKIKKINNLYQSGHLDWFVEIPTITSLSHEVDIIIKFNDEEYSFDEFLKHASEGQKRTLLLIANIIKWYDKEAFVIIDDAFTSMDNHNTNEVLAVINDEKFKLVNFLIFTHNFEWVRCMSFNPKFNKDSYFTIIDKIDDSKMLSVECTGNDFKDLLKTSDIIDGSRNDILTFTTMANIIREVMENNISTQTVKEMRAMSSENNILLDFIDFFDKTIRHYKKNVTMQKLLDEWNKIYLRTPKNTYPIIDKMNELLGKISENETPFGELVISIDTNDFEVKSFIDYIIFKTFIGLQARFAIEKNIIYNAEQEIIDQWESDDQWIKARSYLLGILKSSQDYLAHVNNIQWSRIIEMPIYKILSQTKNEIAKSEQK